MAEIVLSTKLLISLRGCGSMRLYFGDGVQGCFVQPYALELELCEEFLFLPSV